MCQIDIVRIEPERRVTPELPGAIPSSLNQFRMGGEGNVTHIEPFARLRETGRAAKSAERSRQAVAATLARGTPVCPQRVLQPFGKSQVALNEMLKRRSVAEWLRRGPVGRASWTPAL